MQLPEFFTTVTPFSKLLALALLVILPFAGFYAGLKYNEQTPAAVTVPIIQEVPDTKTQDDEAEPEEEPVVDNSIENVDLARCAASLQRDAEVNNTEYVEGSLVVAFQSSVSAAEASRIASSYGLSYTDGQIDTLTVPKGQEFKWICVLEEDDRVRHVGLSELFELHP